MHFRFKLMHFYGTDHLVSFVQKSQISLSFMHCSSPDNTQLDLTDSSEACLSESTCSHCSPVTDMAVLSLQNNLYHGGKHGIRTEQSLLEAKLLF